MKERVVQQQKMYFNFPKRLTTEAEMRYKLQVLVKLQTNLCTLVPQDLRTHMFAGASQLIV
jgi:hypothetical protein